MTAGHNTEDCNDARAALSRKVGASRLWVLGCEGRKAIGRMLADVEPERVCVVEPLMGPPATCVDIRQAGREARERGTILVADLTLPGPICCDALRLGAHASYVDIDERLCVVALSRDGARALSSAIERLDGLVQADDESVAHALSLLELQQQHWHATSDAAQVVASYLRCHPAVCELRYPGLRDDPSFEVAARTLQRGFGPIVDYRLCAGDWQRYHATTRDAREQVLDLERRLSDAGRPA